MREKLLEGLTGDRRSIWFDVGRYRNDPILRDKSSRYYSSKTSMLIDDIYHGTFPVPNFGLKKYSVNLETSNEKTKELLINAIEGRQHPHHELSEAFYDFATECVKCLVAYGYAPYEIVYFSDDKGIPKIFLITLISPSSFSETKLGFRQYVPKAEAVEQKINTQYIDLPKENVLLFKLPKDCETDHHFMMECLEYFGGGLIPEFAMGDLANQASLFSQSDYFTARKLAVAYATKDIGWNARDYGSQYALEWYVWYRQLRFYRFQCLLRNLVIETFNEGLLRIGKKLGFEATISIDGLPTVADADKTRERLVSGDLGTFIEILEQFR